MEYKTTIEIISEASNKDEAVEIAGEYLSGNLISGVRMKCRTAKANARNIRYAASFALIALIFVVGILFGTSTRKTPSLMTSFSSSDAIQPPLKTSTADADNSQFKNEWQAFQTRHALDYLKK